MPKALVINPYWDTLGGGERYTAAFSKMLLDHGWSVDILWPENLSGQIHNRFGINISASFWKNQIYSQLSSINYQLLFWVSNGSLPVSLSGKTIFHLQFPFTGVGGRSLSNMIKSRFYKFVVNSNFTKSFIDREFGVNSVIIYPPVDVDTFKPGKKLKQILYVGRFSNLTQKKGQDVLVREFKRISKKLAGWKLILAGGTRVGLDSESFSALKNSAIGYPVQFITDPDLTQIKKLYSQSRIFWSASGFGSDEKNDPTQVEHFGITVVEAMAAGLVPVITNQGGHREIVTQGVDGFLFDDLPQLSDYTLQLAASQPMFSQLSQSAIAKSKMFSSQKFYEKTWDLVGSGSDS